VCSLRGQDVIQARRELGVLGKLRHPALRSKLDAFLD
jgi:hypothetical protein